ncbi:MAG: AsmA-like C-terminal region-containing protein [Brucellaceae bacterium]|nr:AsmA-like C-terminal region-containing protein [Brucellaceae bacterium]
MKEKPRKIRFNKRDIQHLDQYPSSGAGADNKAVLKDCPDYNAVLNRKAARKARRKRKSFAAKCWRAFASVSFALIVLAGIGFLVLRSGISSEMLRDEAQQRLQTILGPDAGVSISEAHVSLDSNRQLALEARDVALESSIKDISVEKLGVVKLGLAPLPLLTGSIQVARVELGDAVIRLEENNDKTKPFIRLPLNDRGLVDFDLLSREVFVGIDQTLALLDLRGTKAIAMHDVTFAFRAMNKDQEILIRNAHVNQTEKKVTLDAEFVWQGKVTALTAEMMRSDDPKHASDFALKLSNIPVSLGSPEEVMPKIADDRPNPAYFHVNSVASVSLSGRAETAEHKEILSGKLVLDDATVDMGRERGIKGNLALDFEHVAGEEKLEIKTLKLNLGGLATVLEGAFGLEPVSDTEQAIQKIREQAERIANGSEVASQAETLLALKIRPSETTTNTPAPVAADIAEKPAYRFELLSRSAISAPENSAESPLPFGVKIAGRLMQDASRVDFNDLNVKTDSGELYGQGRMIFGHGSPAMIFMLRIPGMPVAQAKQLWPLNVADGARDWVLKNLFGGHMTEGRIDIALAAGHFNGPGLPPDLTESDIKADFKVEGVRFDVIGEIPPVRDAAGTIAVRGAHTTIKLEKGTAFTPANRSIHVDGGTLFVPWGRQRPVIADLDLDLNGEASAITELVGYKPINALRKLPFSAEDLSGNVDAKVKVAFSVTKNAPKDSLQWQADLAFNDVSMKKPFNGQTVTQANGKLSVNEDVAKIDATAKLNNIPAKLSLIEPLADTTIKRQQNVRLELDDKTRAAQYPALNEIFKGPLTLDLGEEQGDTRKISADLGKTEVSLPWLGWKKGSGIPAKLTLDLKLPKDGKGPVLVRNFVFGGTGFHVNGDLTLENNELQSASIRKLNLTRNDDLSLEVRKSGNGFRADVRGKAFDARALIQQAVSGNVDEKKDRQGKGGVIPRIVVNAQIDDVKGFYDESLRNVTVSYETAGAKVSGVSLNAVTSNNAQVSATSSSQNDASSVALSSANAGAVLRFFDFYDKMRGGKITVNLTSQGKGPLYGNIDARDFSVINEPRLDKLVSSSSSGGKSLSQAVNKNIDVSRVDFERGYAQIEKGSGYLTLKNGVIRGPLIGATFQGVLYDRNGNMSVTGTFMPAYGLNRLFGEVPVLGAILGNGRDRGLIGITYKLAGNAKQPNIIVNPISVIAPGIFRSIFEF